LKITLVFPNYLLREDFGEPSDPPLGIAFLASALEQKGYEVEIIDANAENLDMTRLAQRLKSSRPDFAGISCNYSPPHNPPRQIARMIKRELGIPVSAGGNHATALAEYLLKQEENIDFITRGEGETVVPDLLSALENHTPLEDVKGLTFRREGRIVHNPNQPLVADLNSLPLPAYHLLPMEKYARYNIIASRGCPFICSYCASNVIFQRKVRYRSPEKVIEEIELLLKNYGNKRFWFSDDTFISNPKYTGRLTRLMLDKKLPIQWSCLTRVDIVTPELLEQMKQAGCDYLSYGIESGSPEILEKMGKKITLPQIIETLRLTRETGIRQYGFFILGYPGETKQTIMDSFKLLSQVRLDGAAFNVLIPLPATRLMDRLLEEKLISLDEIKWDYLFARTPGETYSSYPAELASRWTNLSSRDLIEACIVGHQLPEILEALRQ